MRICRLYSARCKRDLEKYLIDTVISISVVQIAEVGNANLRSRQAEIQSSPHRRGLVRFCLSFYGNAGETVVGHFNG